MNRARIRPLTVCFFVLSIASCLTILCMGSDDPQFWVEPHSTEQFLQALASPMEEQVICYDPDLDESSAATQQAIEILQQECPSATVIEIPARDKFFVDVYDPYKRIFGESAIQNKEIRPLMYLRGIFEFDIAANLYRVASVIPAGVPLSKEGSRVAAACEESLITGNEVQLGAFVPGVVETRVMVGESGGKAIEQFGGFGETTAEKNTPVQIVAHDPFNVYMNVSRSWSPKDISKLIVETADNIFSDPVEGLFMDEMEILFSLTEMAQDGNMSAEDIALEIMKWATTKIAGLITAVYFGPTAGVIVYKTVAEAIDLVDAWTSGKETSIPHEDWRHQAI
jgi:hypothetical protein